MTVIWILTRHGPTRIVWIYAAIWILLLLLAEHGAAYGTDELRERTYGVSRFGSSDVVGTRVGGWDSGAGGRSCHPAI